MKLEHFAVAANSEKESDRFFINLLGMKKTRSFVVSEELMHKFFGINKEHRFVRYDGNNLSVEVILTEDNSQAKDIFTHNCLLVDDPDDLLQKASAMGFTTIKVPRENGGNYYFIKDTYLNLYEIKQVL
jgi:catechol 2,3-dioxygenase-like lactoylglutathione lyase family enzyme